MKKQITTALTAGILLGAVSALAERPYNIISIGNSFSKRVSTYEKNAIGQIAQLAELNGRAKPLLNANTVYHNRGGSSLYDHLAGVTAAPAMDPYYWTTNGLDRGIVWDSMPATEKWDFVIIQGYRDSFENRTGVYTTNDYAPFTAQLYTYTSSNSPNVVPIVYETWAYHTNLTTFYNQAANAGGPEAMRNKLYLAHQKSYQAVTNAGAADARIAHVGEGFMALGWETSLYETNDWYHPSFERGTLMIGCVMYATLYHDDLSDIAPNAAVSNLIANLTSAYTMTGSDWTQITTVADSVTWPNGRVLVSTNDLRITEGGSASLQIKLSQNPSGTVSVVSGWAHGGNPAQIVSNATVQFTTNNWDAWQTVALSAPEDADGINAEDILRLDAGIMGLRDVWVKVFDNDLPGPRRTVLFDFGMTTNGTFGCWNNVVNTNLGVALADAVDTNGLTTGISLELTDPFNAVASDGVATGSRHPVTALNDSWKVTGTNPGQLRLSGLNPVQVYDLTFFGSHKVTSANPALYTAGGSNVTLDCRNNTNQVAVISGVSPDANGRITLDVAVVNNNGTAALNVLELGYGSTNPVAVTTNFSLAVRNNAGGTATGGGVYADGSNPQITATASNGYQFVNWTGDVSSANSVTNVLMNTNKTVWANFEALPVTNQPPVPSNDSASCDEDGSVSIPVLANDTDPETNTLSIAGITQPANGTAVISGTNVTFTPVANWWGTNTFVYTVSDGQGGSASGTVTVTVQPVNDVPVNTALPSSSGPWQTGSTLTATSGAWNDTADGGGITYAYQWQRADNGAGLNAANIGGATAGNYVLTAADTGKYVRVTVTATDDGIPGSTNASASSAWRGPASQPSDWTAMNGDADQSGVTYESLVMPLERAWIYKADQAPSPAFKGMMAAGSANTRMSRTEPVTFDYVLHTVVDSNRVYFGSSTEESVYALDSSTGARQWVFRAEGAVRLAPVLYNGNIYFGSDGGRVYCLNAASGSLVWSFAAGPTNYLCVGYGRMVSAWPVRAGLLIKDGNVYFSAGVYPTHGCYLYALNAATGSQVWERRINISPNGTIIYSDGYLWVSTGKTSPMEFSLADGTPRIAEPDRRMGCGGWFVGKVDGLPVYGPSDSEALFIRLSTNPPPASWGSDNSYDYSNAVPKGIISGLNGYRTLVDSNRFYLLGRTNDILAVTLDDFRAAVAARVAQIQSSNIWNHGWQAYNVGETDDGPFTAAVFAKGLWTNRIPTNGTGQLRWAIAAGDHLYLGGMNKVLALDAATGDQVWSNTVDGEVRGLAVARGALYASTDKGNIYCFRNGASSTVTNAPSFSNPYTSNTALYADAAATAVQQAGRTNGFCVVLGVGEGQLAYEIAQRSAFFIVAFEKDTNRVAAARQKLAQAGVYGKRVVVYPEAGVAKDTAGYFANLIVSDEAITTGQIPYSPSYVLRMLQPYGGTMVLGSNAGGLDLSAWTNSQMSGWSSTSGVSGVTWRTARRGDLPGAGEWSHHFGNPANTVSSGDMLVSSNLQIQWFGGPGGNGVVERHSFSMPPLVKKGKMYLMTGLAGATAGKATIQCVDSYNGTVLWSNNFNACIRKAAPFNTHSFACLGDSKVFCMSSNLCYELNPVNGQTMNVYNGVLAGYDWGYLGSFSNYLIGTSQGLDADRPGDIALQMDSSWSVFRSRPSFSKDLFVYDVNTRNRLWTYSGGSILNVSITINAASNTIYFLESLNSTSLANTNGLIEFGEFLTPEGTNGARIVALNAQTGAIRWTRPVTRNVDKPYQWICYLTYADDVLLVSRTYHQTRESDGKLWFGYDFEALDAGSGTSLWQAWKPSPTWESDGPSGLSNGKNSMNSHPFYVNGKFHFFARTYGTIYSFDRLTGAEVADPTIGTGWEQKDGKSCTPPVASGTAFYFRNNSQYMYDLATRSLKDITRVTRSGCWMSTVPVGGLVLMPEASSGCNCGFSLQHSQAFAAVLADEEQGNDDDADGLPNDWESQYFGGPTNADANAMASNGVNTVYETYIAGLNPTDPQSRLMLTDLRSLSGGSSVRWSGVSGRVYTIYWSSNLLSGFQPLITNIPWTQGAFTDLVHSAESQGFYRMEVQRSP